jgi:hypothetical protein
MGVGKIATTGAEARIHFSLYAALKRRSSTVVRASVVSVESKDPG